MKLFVAIAAAAKLIFSAPSINMVNAGESMSLYERLAIAADELPNAPDGEPSAEEVNFALAVMRATVAISDDALSRKLTCAKQLTKIMEIHSRATNPAQTHVSEEAWKLLYDELANEMRKMIHKFDAESNLAFARYIQIQQLRLELRERSSLETTRLAHSWLSPSVWHWTQPQPRLYERPLFMRPAEIAQEDALNGTIGIENSFVAHLARQEASIRGDSSPNMLDFLWPRPVNTSSAFFVPAGNKRKAQGPPAGSSSPATQSHSHTPGTVTLHLPASSVTLLTEVNAQQTTTHFDLPASAISSAAGSMVELPHIMVQLPDPSCFPPGLKMFLPELHVHLPVTLTTRPPSAWLRHSSGLIVPGKVTYLSGCGLKQGSSGVHLHYLPSEGSARRRPVVSGPSSTSLPNPFGGGVSSQSTTRAQADAGVSPPAGEAVTAVTSAST
ncbi:hypothetical protein CBOM_03462 [Ceraceosorus bombacis]|uniref:Uncharacterized protein n=1 Tax=Ceraceosorus bombacis TaxID=401625 RepID=A0A0P1BP33_9BASI|nr:hypothetical protein CBOM_03462 [Ceraceosorus bombacis]